MQRIFSAFLAVILSIFNVFGLFISPCEKCDSNINIVCEECNGEGYNYDVEYDVMVVCGQCGSTGEVPCPECSNIAKFFYALQNKLEESAK